MIKPAINRAEAKRERDAWSRCSRYENDAQFRHLAKWMEKHIRAGTFTRLDLVDAALTASALADGNVHNTILGDGSGPRMAQSIKDSLSDAT